MRLEDRLAENHQTMAALTAGAADVAFYCACRNAFCCDSILLTVDEARAAEHSGYRIVLLAHAETDGGEVIGRTARYAAVY